jgi:anti-sigma28 factor (negative regulator of flagellin synthesis)
METEIVVSNLHLNRENEAIELGWFLLESTVDTGDADAPSKPNWHAQAIKHGTHAARHWSRSRSARIEKLRTQVEAGTYQINSTTLAESILKNEDHFLQAH